jgi:amino-acid N-acetyltransferase
VAVVANNFESMKTEQADKYRQSIVALLSAEKLHVADLPASLKNFAVTRHSEVLTGVIGLEIYGNYGLLRSLAVNNNFRNQGIAAELLHHIETLAAVKSLKAVYLLTETAPDYFTRKGYIIIARADVPAEVQQSTEFSHVCLQSAIVMQKIIHPNFTILK